ncbi:ATP-binding cassette glutathione S-conjugate transporter YCF1 ASCRUDRAFT_74772, partial [Ascoidea rubescens DSM 1968]
MGSKFKTSLTGVIYKKSLKLSNQARISKSTGDIVNLMSVDSQRLQDINEYGQLIWSGPYQIILCLISLRSILGNSMWVGFLVMLLLIPFNSYIVKILKNFQISQMKTKDKRVRLVNEMLNNIKSLKLYGWENPYKKKLFYIRNDQELANLKKISVYRAINLFMWNCAPFLVSCSTFAVFVYTSHGAPLTTDIVFPALSLFNLLGFPLSILPMVLNAYVEASVSTKRLVSFLISEELQPDSVTRKPKANKLGDTSVKVENATFLWQKTPEYKVALSNLNFIARKGDLHCIVGKVGSGKSSFLQCLLGDIYKLKGSVELHGKVAYVPQVSWIMNGTVKENILFGHRYDKDFYNKVIRACDLSSDLAILPDGDLTEVGEKGISLSGGQKARLSLARSVYSRADIYLLDDPLSAVDEHVGKHLIDNVLGPNGLLRHKCKVLATNSINVLSLSSNITMLQDGEVVEKGTYNEITKKDSSLLAKLIKEFGKKSKKDEKIEIEPADLDSSATAIHSSSVETDVSVDETVVGSKNVTDNVSVLNRESSFNSSNDSNDAISIISKDIDGTMSLRRASTASFNYQEQNTPGPSDVDQQVVNIREEQRQTGKVKWSIYIEYAKACNPAGVIYVLFFLVSSMALSVAGNYWLKYWAEVNSKYGYNPNVGKYLAVYIALGIGSSLFTFVQTWTMWVVCIITGAKVLHNKMVDSVFRAPMSFFETTPVGRILNRFSSDIDKIDMFLGRVFQSFFTNFVKILFTLFVICSTTWQFIFLIVPLLFLYYYYQQFYVKTSRELKRIESISKSPIFAHFQETLGGTSTIRGYGQQNRFIYLNENKIDQNMKAYFSTYNANRWLAVRLEFLGSLIIFGSAALCVFALKTGHMTSGLLGISVTYALQVTGSLNWMVRMTVDIETNIVSVERVKEYGELPSEAPEIIPNNRPNSEWPSNGSLEFVNYSTRYRQDLELVLKDINLKVKAGEKVGIVGRTGAGKSSLSLALFRIIEKADSKSNIIIDDISVPNIGLADLRHKLSIIPQDAQVFEGTVRENLDPTGRFSDEKIWKALELSHLKEHILSMSDSNEGLSVKLTEGGSNLSVGQRQLVCLARALLIPSKILVLDEATAAVDVETDKIVQKTIRKEFSDRTILTIAHRLNTIMDSDRIVSLDQGRIKEFDSPENLLKDKDSIFYSLCKQGGFIHDEES